MPALGQNSVSGGESLQVPFMTVWHAASMHIECTLRILLQERDTLWWVRNDGIMPMRTIMQQFACGLALHCANWCCQLRSFVCITVFNSSSLEL